MTHKQQILHKQCGHFSKAKKQTNKKDIQKENSLIMIGSDRKAF